MEVSVILEPNDLGGFVAYIPSLQGCVSEGNTKEEALKNIREAIELYLELDDSDIPTDKQVTIEKISL